MKTTRKPKSKRDLLAGTWRNPNDYASDVEFTIKRSGSAYVVRARDTFDGELADVYETAWDGTLLTFACHWNSTGRFARYRVLALSRDRIDVTYTYTDTEVYERNRVKRKS